MAGPFRRVQIAEGVSFSAVQDHKFKHNRLSLSLIMPLEEGKLSQRAIVPFILRQATRKYPDITKLNERLSDLYGAALEASVDKFGAYQLMNLGVVGIDSRFAFDGEDMQQELAQLLADILLDPLVENGAFNPQETELEKEYLRDSIEAEINEKRSYALLRCKNALCAGESLALYKLGTVEEVAAITAESAYHSYEELLNQAQIEIIMTGPGDPEKACEAFRQRFAGRERHPITVDVGQCRKLPLTGEQDIREEMDVKQGKLVLAFRTDLEGSAEELAASRMAVTLLGGIPTSLLFMNVREKLSLCYYCAARLDTVTGIMMVDSGVEAENCEKTKEEILRQLELICRGDFEEQLLTETKLFMKTAFKATGDSLSALESWYLTRILCGEIVSPEENLALSQAVTKEQIIAAAKKLQLGMVYRLLPKANGEVEEDE